MKIENSCRRKVLDIVVHILMAGKVTSDGWLRRVGGHEREVTRHGLGEVSCPCARVQNDMGDTIKGDGDCPWCSRTRVSGGNTLGNVMECLGKGYCLCIGIRRRDQQQGHYSQTDQYAAHSEMFDFHAILLSDGNW